MTTADDPLLTAEVQRRERAEAQLATALAALKFSQEIQASCERTMGEFRERVMQMASGAPWDIIDQSDATADWQADDSGTVCVVFDGPPSHESGRFVEVENVHGNSVNVGDWRQRGDGLWELRITRNARAADLDAARAETRSVRAMGEAMSKTIDEACELLRATSGVLGAGMDSLIASARSIADAATDRRARITKALQQRGPVRIVDIDGRPCVSGTWDEVDGEHVVRVAGRYTEPAAAGSWPALSFVDRCGLLVKQASDGRYPSLAAVRQLIREFYDMDGNIVGGNLNIVLDDDNTERHHVEYCRTHAANVGDQDGHALADLLLVLTDTDREHVVVHRVGEVYAQGSPVREARSSQTGRVDQATPKHDPSKPDVWAEIIDYARCRGMSERFLRVAHDRRALGIGRYGTPLQPWNERDVNRDLNEELLDATAYAGQRAMERRGILVGANVALAQDAQFREILAIAHAAVDAL